MRFAPVGYAITWASVPLFPSFITFTSVQFPGVSVVPFAVGLIVAALMLVLAVWGVVAMFIAPPGAQPLLKPMLAFLAAATLSAIVGLNPRDSVIFLGIMVLSVFWHVSSMRDYQRQGVARAIYWTFMLTGIASCLLAIGMVVTRIPALQYVFQHGRAVGTFVLPGELAGYLIAFIAVAVGLAQVAQSRALRVTAAIACALGAVTMLLTFSRTGFVGLACAAGFYVAMRARERKQGIVLAATLVLCAVALVLLFFNERHNPSENYTRLAIWQAAVGAIERYPLLGVGPIGFSHIYPLVRLPDGDEVAFHAHSMYLTYLAELGIVGLSAFLWILVSFARELRARIVRATPEAALFSLAIAAGVVGMLVQGLIDTVSVVMFGLLFPTLSLALAAAQSGTGDA